MCGRLNQTVEHAPEACGLWYKDECEIERGGSYCDNVQGSKAWKRKHGEEEEQKEYGWDEDGMPWLTFCKDVVGSMAGSEAALEQTVGKGWQQWCKDYLNKAGDEKAAAAMGSPKGVPPGTGIGMHPRLPVSRLPAPRYHDHQDTV
mmetsp:Transcript_49812/g.100031  ORF Transcript_49812/g.100031 Transcript_49812/m.100031 type:complete len:146 (-) Transcript_49812:98-535(-)